MSEALTETATETAVETAPVAATTMSTKDVHGHPHVRAFANAILNGQKANPPSDKKLAYSDSIKRGEDTQKYLTRLHSALASYVTDEDWSALPEAAQMWHNESIRAIKANGTLPLPAADAAAPAAASDTAPKATRKTIATVPDAEVLTPEEQAKVEEARKLLDEVKQRKRAKVHPEKAAKERKERTARTYEPKQGFTTRACIRYIISNPDASVDQIVGEAKAQNSDLSEKTIKLIYKNMENIITDMKELGRWKDAA